MNKLLTLLLLTPIIALAQELPDEDWVCLVDDAWSVVRLYGVDDFPEKSEYAILDIQDEAETIILNPAKGYKSVKDSFWGGSCQMLELLPEFEISCSDIINSAAASGIVTSLILDRINGHKFTYSKATIDRTDIYFGSCNKL